MTTRSEIERVLDRYLADGAEQVPDRVIDAALDQIDSTNQRRALRVPWRFDTMPTVFKLALGGAAVVAVLLVGGIFLSRGPTASVGGPPIGTASPSASVPASVAASPSASVALTNTSNWVPFTSDLYGYSIARPPTWVAEPATRDWSLDTVDRTNWIGYRVADRFRGSDAGGLDTLVTSFADDVPAGTSEDEWMAAYFEPEGEPTEGCGTLSEDVRPIAVDGHSGTLVNEQPCSDTIAFVFIDGRVHVFAVWRDNQEALLDAFLSTVEFQQ